MIRWRRTTHSSLGGALSVRLAAAIWRYWWRRGHIGEGRRWLARALAVPTRDTSPAASPRVTWRCSASRTSRRQGGYRSAVAYMTESWHSYRAAGDETGSSSRCSASGIVSRIWARQRGTQLCAEGVALGRQLGDPIGLAVGTSIVSAGRADVGPTRAERGLQRRSHQHVPRSLANSPAWPMQTSSKSYAFADLGDSARAWL